jgi:hypothetical protein
MGVRKRLIFTGGYAGVGASTARGRGCLEARSGLAARRANPDDPAERLAFARS